MNTTINTFEDLLNKCTSSNKNIYEIAQEYMSKEEDITIKEIRKFTLKTLNAMKEAINNGLNSRELSFSKLCGQDCYKVIKRFENNNSLFGKAFEKVIKYALATSEENIRMGRIVACPTAGSCGIVPAALITVSEELNLPEEKQINALITAGEAGRIISNKVSLAGAVAGCQAECGVASAMAASAVCYLKGGNCSQIINSCALALKNILGLTCDPVAGLVEVPCVKRNPFLAVHAITAAELALADVESKIPADEVVDAMTQIGNLMSPMLKESSEAGLATTKTALEITSKIFK